MGRRVSSPPAAAAAEEGGTDLDAAVLGVVGLAHADARERGQDVVVKVAPGDLADPHADRVLAVGRQGLGPGVRAHAVEHLARADDARGQVRPGREERRVLGVSVWMRRGGESALRGGEAEGGGTHDRREVESWSARSRPPAYDDSRLAWAPLPDPAAAPSASGDDEPICDDRGWVVTKRSRIWRDKPKEGGGRGAGQPLAPAASGPTMKATDLKRSLVPDRVELLHHGLVVLLELEAVNLGRHVEQALERAVGDERGERGARVGRGRGRLGQVGRRGIDLLGPGAEPGRVDLSEGKTAGSAGSSTRGVTGEMGTHRDRPAALGLLLHLSRLDYDPVMLECDLDAALLAEPERGHIALELVDLVRQVGKHVRRRQGGGGDQVEQRGRERLARAGVEERQERDVERSKLVLRRENGGGGLQVSARAEGGARTQGGDGP